MVAQGQSTLSGCHGNKMREVEGVTHHISISSCGEKTIGLVLMVSTGDGTCTMAALCLVNGGASCI